MIPLWTSAQVEHVTLVRCYQMCLLLLDKWATAAEKLSEKLTYSSTSNTDTSIDFTIIPDSNDIISSRNQLLDITADQITVTGTADTVASGETSAGVGYTTSSSYS